MRTVLILSALCLAACAGTQPAARSVAQTEEDKKHVAEAIKYGYKVVNQNGDTLYCRSDWATASHIQKNTVCLTAQQLDDLSQKNDRDYGQPNRAPMPSFQH